MKYNNNFNPEEKKEELNLEILPEHRIRFWLLDTYFDLLNLSEEVSIGQNIYRKQRALYYKVRGLNSFLKSYLKKKSNGKKLTEDDKKIITNLEEQFIKILSSKKDDNYNISEDDAYNFMDCLQEYYYMKGFTKLDAIREDRPPGLG